MGAGLTTVGMGLGSIAVGATGVAMNVGVGIGRAATQVGSTVVKGMNSAVDGVGHSMERAGEKLSDMGGGTVGRMAGKATGAVVGGVGKALEGVAKGVGMAEGALERGAEMALDAGAAAGAGATSMAGSMTEKAAQALDHDAGRPARTIDLKALSKQARTRLLARLLEGLFHALAEAHAFRSRHAAGGGGALMVVLDNLEHMDTHSWGLLHTLRRGAQATARMRLRPARSGGGGASSSGGGASSSGGASSGASGAGAKAAERLGGGAAAVAAAAASAAAGPAAGSSTKPGCSAVLLFCLVLLDDAHMASAHFGEGQPPSVEYLEAVAAARAAATVLDVPPLRREHARRLVVQTAGATPLPAEATELLLDLSQGNPLILRELITQVLANTKLVGKFAKYASNTLAQDTSAQERGLAWGAKYEQAAAGGGGGEAADADAASGYARPGKTKNLTVHHLRALLEEMLVFSPRLRGLALQDFGMLSPRALMVAKTAAVYDLFFTRALLREMAAPLLGENPSTQGGAPAFDAALAECEKLKVFAEVSLAESGLGAQEHAGDAGEDEVSSGLPSGSGGLLTVLQRADPGASMLLCFSNPLTQKAVMDLLLQAQLQQVRRRRRARPAACDAACEAAACEACSPARLLIRSSARRAYSYPCAATCALPPPFHAR